MAQAKNRTPMPETWYRASRWHRVLGNPQAYHVLKTLGRQRLDVSEVAARLGQRLNTISDTLRHLRQVDLVRYETRGRHKTYWIKDARIPAILRMIERIVDRMRCKAW